MQENDMIVYQKLARLLFFCESAFCKSEDLFFLPLKLNENAENNNAKT
jgi:hypothetical protein